MFIIIIIIIGVGSRPHLGRDAGIDVLAIPNVCRTLYMHTRHSLKHHSKIYELNANYSRVRKHRN